MTDIEIPYQADRGRRYRFFEMLPGLLTWSMLLLPFVLAVVSPRLCVLFIVGYLLLWFVKAIGLNVRAIQGYRMIQQHQRLPWADMIEDLEQGKASRSKLVPDWHRDNVERLKHDPGRVKASEVVHAIIIAAYNEVQEVIEPTVQSVLDSDFDAKRVILVLAYEGRDGAQSKKPCKAIVKKYGDKFLHTMAVEHPFNPQEVRGKGGNITYAARKLTKYIEKQGIDPAVVPVTTLDSDNRPHKQYLNALTYMYAVTPDPQYVSYQPVPIYTNNIWDAPAPMRVIATGNSFWNVVLSMRHHMIRNFSSHAQSLEALIETDYWSVRTIVEDGHQFWRSYFTFNGRHEVYPLFVPIYQDAVLSDTLRKTLKMQFVQLRRWAWGASDIAYVADKGFFTPSSVPRFDMLMKFGRLVEGHVTWAVAPLILAFSAFIPALFNPDDFAANQLPLIASRIQTLALVGITVTLFLSMKMLPKKPERYKRRRTLWMIVQWVMLPVTTIGYNSFAALYSQTRLIFGRYMDTFDVTDKAVVTEDKGKVI